MSQLSASSSTLTRLSPIFAARASADGPGKSAKEIPVGVGSAAKFVQSAGLLPTSLVLSASASRVAASAVQASHTGLVRTASGFASTLAAEATRLVSSPQPCVRELPEHQGRLEADRQGDPAAGILPQICLGSADGASRRADALLVPEGDGGDGGQTSTSSNTQSNGSSVRGRASAGIDGVAAFALSSSAHRSSWRSAAMTASSSRSFGRGAAGRSGVDRVVDGGDSAAGVVHPANPSAATHPATMIPRAFR